MAPISLRFKRKDTTLFLVCEPGDSFRKIKTRISEILAVKGGIDNIKTFADDKEKEYLDEQILSDFTINDNTIIFLSLGGEAIA